MLSRVKLTNAHTARGRPTLKQHRVFSLWDGPRPQKKIKEIVKTFKDHGPHRLIDKWEYQECT